MNSNHDERDDGLELSAEQQMQALLCAYVLGEVDEAERAQVEAALANSPELRAEKARLEHAAKAVSGVLKERAGEALSTQSRGELDAAAARRARPTFFNQPLVRLAAGLAVVAGGYALYQKGLAPASESEVHLAQAEPGASGGQLAPSQRAEGASSAPKDASSANPSASIKVEEGEGARTWNGAGPAATAPAEPAPQSAAVGGERDGLGAEQAQLGDALSITGGTLEALDGEARARQQFDSGAFVAGASAAPSTPPAVGAAPAPGATGVRGGVATAVGGKFAGRSGGHDRIVASSAGPSSAGPAASSSPAPARRRREEPKALRELGYADGAVASGAVDSEEAEIVAEEIVEGADEFFLGKGEGGRFGARREQPTELDLLRRRYQHIHEHCVLPIGPIRPRDMFFRYWGDNPFELALLDRQSTFSIDVDTASYTLARRYLVEGQLPTKEQIRTEEFVNYFKGDVPPPTEGTFAVATEFAPSLFGDDSNTWMLRVAVRGKEVSKAERQPVALTFVVDVSGSMREGARLELVKHSLRLLVSQMDASDSISLVKFSNDAALILPMTSARQKDLIESAIHPLQPEGSTNTEAGLRMGYEQALAALTPNANNRVVLLTDGVANVGITDPNALVQMVERQRKAGIYLNTVGVGMNNHNDNLLEQLANKGDGLCNYVDDEQEVRRALVDNFTGAFQVIARDVKVQVEFDPAQVERYRLLGYENRAIADADFRNDKVDAGEVGAGHQVVALYEIVRRNTTGDGPLATVRLRWKPPFQAGVPQDEQGAAQELAQPVHAAQSAASYAATSAGYRRSVLVAQFAEFLRRSVHARRDSLERLIDEARKLSSELRDSEFEEFVDMAVRSRELIRAELARRDWLDDCGHLLRHRHYLHGQLDELRRRFPQRFDDPSLAAEFEAHLRELQTRLGELEARIAGERGEADAEMVKRLEAENIELQRRLIELLERARTEQDGK